MEVIFRKQKFGDPKPMLERLKNRKIPHSVRLGSECTEVLVYDRLFTFTSTKNFPRAKLFLFNSVKRDVIKWLKNKQSLELPIEFPVTKFNPDYPYNDVPIGIDLNHAYWRIAYIKGIISEKTYNHGLHGDCKALRLSTLSVLGREKSFEVYGNVETIVDGNPVSEYKLIEKKITQKENLLQRAVFKYIRLVCYDMMHTVSMKLGPDFDCWKTDCIYFHDTKENRKIVTDYFNRKKMTYKFLDYDEDNIKPKALK